MIARFRNSPRAGLSLLELLIALALLALITGGLASSLSLSLRLYDRSQSLEAVSAETALRGSLRRWLMSALPPSRLIHIPGQFDGGPEQLSFVTLADTPFAPQAALLKVTVAVQEDCLLMTLDYLDDSGATLNSDTRVIAANWTGGAFSYFDDSEDGEWQSEWRGQPALPRLIRIEASPGTTPDWPDFIVRPRLEP